MKITLIVIGKENAEIFEEAVNYYFKKINFYSFFEIMAIPYLKNCKFLSVEEQKKTEGELFLKKIDTTDFVVVLDENGKKLSSVDFASFIQQNMNAGLKKLVFLIGGAYGFSEAVYARKNYSLSLSNMTFPHIMTRLIFSEQLYRAFTILNHEPYHHI
ncbi:MAG: 23S rRNA (pseudouridine(1915)-N(3))-methyltransferase RlmH [Bacteroidales bacterium]|jgi:23S rRNA (pseudouridine1915-N3)-methyltransferase|nr:23S rRNA (pseudouridine(1915)-N(3))-methyltransferase RlmH [Bacteroidales bacterium]